MKVVREEAGTHHASWFKTFEKKLFANLSKIQEFLITWRIFLLSAEFWSLSWLWTAFWLKLCSLRIRFSIGQSARRTLMTWVSGRVPKLYVAKGFPACFKDGILLCALVEKTVPGSCPRFDLLDPDQPLRNLKLALHLIEKHVKIKSTVIAEEILDEEKFPEKKLLLLLSQIKVASEKFGLQSPASEPPEDFLSQTTFVSDTCFARGMGLLLAVRGRKACFTILMDSIENLDMVIEIRGPKNTAVSKRITSAFSLSRSDSSEFRDVRDDFIEKTVLSKRIPLEYSILGRKISVSYTPLESGVHYMSIIWQGQHIMGSPYTITVDNSVDAPDIWNKPSKRCYRRLKRSAGQDIDDSVEDDSLPSSVESAARITRKKVIRYIVKMDGKDVVIDGKENLCEAINNIKNQRTRTPVSREESVKVNEDPAYTSTPLKESDDTENNTEIESGSCNELSALSSVDSESNEELLIRLDSPVSVEEKEPVINQDSESEEWNINYLNKSNTFEIPDTCSGRCSKDVGCYENKSFEEIFKMKNFNSDLDLLTRSSSEDTENLDVKPSEIDIRKMNFIENVYKSKNNLTKEFPIEIKPEVRNKSAAALSDEDELDSQSDDKIDNFSNNEMNSNANSDVSPPSTSDDLCFFPVHKVQYAAVNDDDEDTDDTTDYSSTKRRTSFTELHESNYLDEVIKETERSERALGENFCSVVESNKDIDTSGIFQSAATSYGSGDIRDCLRANHDLFQCDHSLGFWSETVTETPPDIDPYDNNFFLNFSEIINSSLTDDKLTESSVDFGISSKFDSSLATESGGVGYKGKNPFENNFCDFTDADFRNLLSFSLMQNTDANKREDCYSDSSKKSVTPTDCKKRMSWPERDLLPSIQESSFEGVMDLETYNDKMRNKEIRENNNLSLNIPKIKLNDPVPPPPVSTTVKFKDGDSPSKELFSKNDKLSAVLLEKEPAVTDKDSNIKMNKSDSLEESDQTSSLTSKNVPPLSTTQNKKSSKMDREIKFSTCTYLERNKQRSSFDGTSSDTESSISSSSQNRPNSYYASPVIMGNFYSANSLNKSDSMKMSGFGDTPDSYEYSQEPAQCLSVKRVVQIFQKEKEEPIDTWPTESPNVKGSQKIFRDEILRSKMGGSSDLSDLESYQFTNCGELPGSSIKDRVKLFESASTRGIQI